MKNGRRRRIEGHVTEESERGWDAFSDHHGVTISAMIEVIGIRFAQVCAGSLSSSRRLTEMVEQARAVDRERRKRKDCQP